MARNQTEFVGLLAREEAAQVAMQTFKSGVAIYNDARGDDGLEKLTLELELLESQEAIRDGAVSYNRRAKDLDSLRKLVEFEIGEARAVFASAEACTPAVPVLAGPTADDCRAYADAVIEREIALAQNEAACMAAKARLAAVFAAVEAATGKLNATRKANSLPRCSPVLPRAGALDVGLPYKRPPQNVAGCDALLATLEAERHPDPKAPRTNTQAMIANLRKEVEAIEAKREADAKRQALLADPAIVADAATCGITPQRLCEERGLFA